MKKTANSIIAKARAMATGSLDENSYAALASCGSVAELAAYLHERTHYSRVLDTVTISDISRERLEAALAKYIFLALEKLARYEAAAGGSFYKYINIEQDIEVILTCVRLIHAGSADDIKNLPFTDRKHTNLDFVSLLEARSYPELVESLQKTPYGKVLSGIRFDEGTPHMMISFEHEMDKFIKNRLTNLIDKNCTGKSEKAEIRDFFSRSFDISKLISIIRLSRMSGERYGVSQLLIDDGYTLLTPGRLKRLSADPSFETASKMLAEYIGVSDISSPEDDGWSYLYRLYKKEMIYSQNPIIVMYSFLFLTQNEIKNITHITEAIRYGYPKDSIMKLLTI